MCDVLYLGSHQKQFRTYSNQTGGICAPALGTNDRLQVRFAGRTMRASVSCRTISSRRPSQKNKLTFEEIDGCPKSMYLEKKRQNNKFFICEGQAVGTDPHLCGIYHVWLFPQWFLVPEATFKGHASSGGKKARHHNVEWISPYAY